MTAHRAAPDMDDLFLRYCDTRDIALRNTLLERYLYIADIVARRFSGRGVEYDDLYQIASVALIRAMERFECGRGVQFQTYATPFVIGEVRNYFRDKARIIRMPRRSAEGLSKVRKAREALTASLMRTPTPDEIAAHTGISLETLLELLDTGSSMQVASLDAMVGPGTEMELGGMLGGDEEGYDRLELRDYLERVIETLTPPERDIILKRYFMHKSQREVADAMNVSQMYVSRMERRVLDKFRQKATAANDE